MINSPSSEPPPRPSDSPQSSSTTAPTPLPSIRHLHPYLPPQPPPAYYPGPSSRLESDALGHSVDSDNDDPDSQGPPKKKRRRQALSCTECKRRKIKCDRNQPCAPCSRRGEQAKCQWHVVEPVRLITRSAPSSSSSSEKYVSRAEYDELKSRFELLEASVIHRFEYLDRFMSTHPLSMAEPGSVGSATSGHSPSGSGSSAPRTTPAAAVAAQHVTDVPVAVPDYNQGPSTGYGTAGTPGDGLVPATNFPSSFSKSSTAGLAHFSPLMHQSNTASYIKHSPPPEHLMHPPNLPEVLHRRKSSLVKEYTSTGHNYQPIGPLGSTSSASSGIHTRQRSLSSIASIGSRSPIPDHSASGMAAASSPVLQHRMVRVSSSITPTATSSAVKNPAFSLASITSPFDSEPGFSSRASGVIQWFSDNHPVKKLPRADAQAGRTSAPPQPHPRIHSQALHPPPSNHSHSPYSAYIYANPSHPAHTSVNDDVGRRGIPRSTKERLNDPPYFSPSFTPMPTGDLMPSQGLSFRRRKSDAMEVDSVSSAPSEGHPASVSPILRPIGKKDSIPKVWMSHPEGAPTSTMPANTAESGLSSSIGQRSGDSP
ncbi:hypothetical protein D9757_002588 [Collybiopsis confluens]|uniref:Zn(2)-C6 fungal-type domain-containing protein n=1 Tax=Collybiopsis confluens TaxID=2823264 RepID=A0A8H5ME66_9AGAR|nr:hypothetical protein D9757_002588 [Collybiopsis confluens]